MADFAAHLIDRGAPSVGVRQWVLTVPPPLRARMMFDPRSRTIVTRATTATVVSLLSGDADFDATARNETERTGRVEPLNFPQHRSQAHVMPKGLRSA
jgi:hypothetical protein